MNNLPSWLQSRSSGILLHLTSLPGKYGVGNLGLYSRQFIDFLNESGFSFWQTCPLGPTGYGDSPYQVFSSFAGNPYLIDWDPILELNLIDEHDLVPLLSDPGSIIDYGNLYNHFLLLRLQLIPNLRIQRIDARIAMEVFCNLWMEIETGFILTVPTKH